MTPISMQYHYAPPPPSLQTEEHRGWTDRDFTDFKARNRTTASYIIPVIGIIVLVSLTAGGIVYVVNARKKTD